MALHADGLGSIALASDATQIVVERTTYTAFGVPARQGSAGVQPFAFTGREWDVELGLYYYRARYYDPKVGRFLSRDPLGAGPNPYTYVAGDPVNRIDPYGLEPWDHWDFWQHYLEGSGDPVDLAEVGRLSDFVNSASVRGALSKLNLDLSRLAAFEAAKLCGRCDKGIKSGSFPVSEKRLPIDLTFEDPFADLPYPNWKVVLGQGSLRPLGSCRFTADCGSGTCVYSCDVDILYLDVFQKPFNFRGYGTDREVPGTSTYWLGAHWREALQGSTNFRR